MKLWFACCLLFNKITFDHELTTTNLLSSSALSVCGQLAQNLGGHVTLATPLFIKILRGRDWIVPGNMHVQFEVHSFNRFGSAKRPRRLGGEKKKKILTSSFSGILLFQQQVNDSHHLADGSRRRRTVATAARHLRSSHRWESCLDLNYSGKTEWPLC